MDLKGEVRAKKLPPDRYGFSFSFAGGGLPPVPCERNVGTQMYLKFEVTFAVGRVCVGLAALHISGVEKIMKEIT